VKVLAGAFGFFHGKTEKQNPKGVKSTQIPTTPTALGGKFPFSLPGNNGPGGAGQDSR